MVPRSMDMAAAYIGTAEEIGAKNGAEINGYDRGLDRDGGGGLAIGTVEGDWPSARGLGRWKGIKAILMNQVRTPYAGSISGEKDS